MSSKPSGSNPLGCLGHFRNFLGVDNLDEIQTVYSIASRIPPGRLLSVVCLVACWFVVFASVCMFFRSWNLLAHSSGACLGGLLGFILGARGVAWAPFWNLWAPLGVDLGGLGLPWAPFLGLWDSSGAFGAPWGPPWPPKVPKAKFSHFFPSHFGLILGPFWR